MNLRIVCAAAVLAATIPAGAQCLQVTGMHRVPVAETAYHPVFSPDGKNLLVTSEAFDGLRLVSIADGQAVTLTTLPGAGYKPALSADGSAVLVRAIHPATQTMSLYSLDTRTRAVRQVAADVEHVTNLQLSDGRVRMAVRGKAADAALPPVWLAEEDLKLALYVDGRRTVLDPVKDATGADVNYCWSSLSPDGKRALFVAHNTAYVCRIDGSGLTSLGSLHAPVWRDNNCVVGMEDVDDGHRFTASNIVAVSADGLRRQHLTQGTPGVEAEMYMYPAVSADGSRIAFHTLDGALYLMTVTSK